MATEILATKLKVERLQTRENTNQQLIDDYAERMKAGDGFPPITVVTDGKTEWLTDGIHRLDAAIAAKVKIGVNHFRGDRIKAVEMACGANISHGLRRSNADKRRAVKLALKEFPDRSDRLVAELCAVSHEFVRSCRPQVSTVDTSKNGEPTKQVEKRTGKDGKSYPAASAPDSFDPAALEAQPAPPLPKSGKPTVSVKDRKDCHAHLGGLIRALGRVGLYDEFHATLDAIAVRLKTL